jgi:hypothetical protein
MPDTAFMNDVPLWIIFPATCIIVMAFWEVGYRFGHKLPFKGIKDSEQSVTTLVSIIVGLVAFLLAFTFNMAAQRFQDRRDILVEDVNAIGTAYLRTDTISEPERSNIKELLREYIDNRLNIAASQEIEQRIRRAGEIQEELWRQTARATEKDRSPVAALFEDAMNNMIDLHTKRVTNFLKHHIPDSIWIALFALTALGIAAMGYQNGLLDHGRSPAVFIVSLMFAIVIFMIADLDRPGHGLITVDQQAMTDLKNSISDK